jgi:hypothetical protein
MLMSVWCLIVIALSLAVLGVPLQWLLNGRRPLDDTDWICVPFVGMAAIALPLQTLVYFGVPLVWTTLPLWLLGLALTAWHIRGGGLQLSLTSFPWRPYLVALAVFAVQGAGLFVLGAHAYVGRAWSDQFNYTAIAEFLIHFPHDTPFDEMVEHPWLGWVLICLKSDRIGQSILQGFWACSCGTGAKALFEPTILLGPSLTALVIYAMARRLGTADGPSLLGAAAAGLVPALTLVHLESFLSQALAVPLMLMFTLLLHDLARQPSWGATIRAGLLFTLTISVYTEFTPLLLGLLTLAAILPLLRGGASWRLTCCYGGVILGPLLFNPLYGATTLRLLQRVTVPLLGEVYPWALSREGWARLWLGDMAATGKATLRALAHGYAMLVTVLAYVGLLAVTWRLWKKARSGANEAQSFGLAASLLSLAALPIVILMARPDCPYQFYKLLLTIAPVLVLGLAVFVRAWPGWFFVALVLALSVLGTGAMVQETVALKSDYRSNAAILANVDLLELQTRLERSHGQNLVIAQTNGFDRAWLSYFARHNRVWLCEPSVIDWDMSKYPPIAERLRFDLPPADVQLITESSRIFSHIEPGDVRRVWSGEKYALWQTNSAGWAVPGRAHNSCGWERLEGRPFFWIGGAATEIDILAGSAGQLTLSAHFQPGPGLPDRKLRRLRIRTSAGHDAEWCTEGGDHCLDMPIPAGKSTVYLESLDQPASHRPGDDPRPLLLGVHGLSMSFRPATDLAEQP